MEETMLGKFKYGKSSLRITCQGELDLKQFPIKCEKQEQ